MKHIHAVAVGVLVTASAAAAQSPVDGIVDRAVAAYARTKTSTGTFEQAITNPLTGSTVRTRGEFEQQRQPARFAFRFLGDQKGDVIVGDGTWLWVYVPSSTPGQVIKMPMTQGGAGSLDLASRFFDSPRTRFTISDGGTATVAGRATHALVLEPKSDREPFSRAKVWVDVADGTLRQFETIEGSGLKRLVTVTAVSPNAPVNRKAFMFSPPRGTRVVDQKALGAR